MKNLSSKEKVEKVIHNLPKDASIEDAIERLYLLYKVDKGIEQADTEQTVSDKEARDRLKKWLA